MWLTASAWNGRSTDGSLPPVPEVRQDGGRFPDVAALSIIPEPSRLERRVWIIISLLAVATGIFFRFRGFATWPLATDEYYIFRAMTFVLSGGLPEFPCGGYYSRGLLYQYITAPLLAAGIAPEAALRTVSILSNLAMLPAAWLLAHRLGGLRMAAVAVTILALSVWEIEMARFGRMYAPFQTLFLWYLYHLYNLMVTGEHRRWRYLIALSFAGPLVWEGGVILPVLNFIPLLAGTRYWLLRHGAAAVALLVAALVFASINFRTLGPDSAQPPLADGPGASGRPLVDSFPLLLPELPLWAWLIVLGLPLLGAMLVRNHWRRLDFRAWLALAAIAGALLLNQLLLAAMVAIGAVLIRWLPWSLASGKPLRWAWLALGGIAVYWAVYALVVHEDGLSLTRRLRLLIGFPDLYWGCKNFCV